MPVFKQIMSYLIKRAVRNWEKSLYTGENIVENWKYLLDLVNTIKETTRKEHISKLSIVKEGAYLLYSEVYKVVKLFSEKIERGDKEILSLIPKIRRSYKELFGKESEKPLSSFFFQEIASIEIPFVVNNKIEIKSLSGILTSKTFKEKFLLC